MPELEPRLHSSILPLVSWRGGAFEGHGTAFTVGVGGLMITAGHVVSDLLDGHEFKAGAVDLFVVWTHDEPEPSGDDSVVLLRVTAVSTSSSADVALLTVEQPVVDGKQVAFPKNRFAARMLDKGELVVGAGYSSINLSGLASPGQPATIFFDRKLMAEGGKVIDQHPVARDRFFLSFPTIQTDAAWAAGMSGGPVVDTEGTVVGIVCSSMKSDADGGAWASYACLIAPVLPLTAELIDPETHAQRAIQFGELVLDEAIEFDFYEDFQVVESLEGIQTQYVKKNQTLP